MTVEMKLFLFFSSVVYSSQIEGCMNGEMNCICSNPSIQRMEVKIGLQHLLKNGICKNNKPRDCEQVYNQGHRTNGVYRIYPQYSTGYNVYCDMTTDGGGWTVIQRRYDGSEDFYKNWAEYQAGFGNKNKEYWLGNEKIHLLTRTKYQLRVDLEDFKGVKKYALYSSFSIGNNDTAYQLSIDGYKGTAGDSLAYHKKQKFATKDNDDKNGSAVKYKGAWWYKGGYYSSLNGMYIKGGKSDTKSMNWYHFHNRHTPLKSSEMKVKQRP